MLKVHRIDPAALAGHHPARHTHDGAVGGTSFQHDCSCPYFSIIANAEGNLKPSLQPR